MKEYAIWGVPPGADDETLLCAINRETNWESPTMADARRIVGVLENKHGCRRVRIQCLDMSAPAESVQDMFRGAVRGNAR
jgi:hypothetical protein